MSHEFAEGTGALMTKVVAGPDVALKAVCQTNLSNPPDSLLNKVLIPDDSVELSRTMADLRRYPLKLLLFFPDKDSSVTEP
jgi:hypothetical protein